MFQPNSGFWTMAVCSMGVCWIPQVVCPSENLGNQQYYHNRHQRGRTWIYFEITLSHLFKRLIFSDQLRSDKSTSDRNLNVVFSVCTVKFLPDINVSILSRSGKLTSLHMRLNNYQLLQFIIMPIIISSQWIFLWKMTTLQHNKY